MTGLEFHIAFLRGINKFDDTVGKPTTKEIEEWLNLGKDKFFTTRYTGINAKQQGFEQSQKRIDDLRTCIRKVGLESLDHEIPEPYKFRINELDEPYVHLISDEVYIVPSMQDAKLADCWPKDENGDYIPQRTTTLEVTHDTLQSFLHNSLSEHRYMYGEATPLRIMWENDIWLYTDDRYGVKSYQITYLTNPSKIDIHTSPTDSYTGLPEHTHREIVQIAVDLYLAATGGQTIQLQVPMEAAME